MFDRLWEILANIWHDLLPWIVIDAYQNGGRLRLGQYHSTLTSENGLFGTGLHLKIPFADQINAQNVCVTTMRLPPQTLETKDGVNVVAGAMVRYFIKDIQPYIVGITDQGDVLIDITLGAILKAIKAATYAELQKELPEAAVLEKIRTKVNKYGFKIEEVTFTDFGRARSFRLIQPHASNLAN